MDNAGWQWERVLLGVWMLATLVLTKSYAGNLMSLLAVRHIPQPFHTLRAVLDHPSVTAVWQKGSGYEQLLRSTDSGILSELLPLENIGRLKFHPLDQFATSLDQLVRRGDHVLVDLDTGLKTMLATDFSNTGNCDFYLSREGYVPFMVSGIAQKNSPLIPGLNRMHLAMGESGLFVYWVEKGIPNSTRCSNTPRQVVVRSTLSMGNLYGMFVLLAAGQGLAAVVLSLEVIHSALCK